jgi:hypothetical protein
MMRRLHGRWVKKHAVLACPAAAGKGVVNAARLKRASLLKVALVAIVLAGALLGLAAPSKAQSEPLPDLTVLKTGPATASQGDTVTWDITMTNIGSGSAVVAALPPGSDQKTILQDVFTSTTREEFIASRWIQEAVFPYDHCFGGFQQPGQIRLGWFLCPNINQPVDVIPPGGVRPFTVTIVGVSPTVESTVITNCATVDPDNVIEESNESNNISCMVTVVGDAAPTSKAECKNGGYKGFGFKNQGQCVAFVQRGAKNSQ